MKSQRLMKTLKMRSIVLNNQLSQSKILIGAFESSEKRLKEQILNKNAEFDNEVKEFRAKLSKEKKQAIKYQEECLKSRNEYEKKKNEIIKEMIEKDKIIDKLTLELNELKIHMRKQETLNYENKLKEANRISIDKSLVGYETNEAIIKSTRELGRSRSPFNDNTISDTIMYGGASVLDSIIAAFPVDKHSVSASQEVDTKYKGSVSPVIKQSSRNIQNRTSNNLKSYKNFDEISNSSHSINQKNEEIRNFKINNFSKRLSEYDPDRTHNQTERRDYLDTNKSSTSNLFLPNKFGNLEKNKSTTLLAKDFSNLNTFKNDQTQSKQRMMVDNNLSSFYDNNGSNYSKIMEENVPNINNCFDNKNARNSKCRADIPYQDTFDNCGTNYGQPLASARYQHINTINDSCCSDQNRDVAITHRVRHHRNISHASFPSDDSNENHSMNNSSICLNPNLDQGSKNNIKHSQSVLQFKDRFKVEKKRLLRVEIDPYDDTEIDLVAQYKSAIQNESNINHSNLLENFNSKGKENDQRAINNMKALSNNLKQKKANQQSITPRETSKQPSGFGYICNQKANQNKFKKAVKECDSRNVKRRTHSSQFIPRQGDVKESYDSTSNHQISMFDIDCNKRNKLDNVSAFDPNRIKHTPKNNQNLYHNEVLKQKEMEYNKMIERHRRQSSNFDEMQTQNQSNNGDVYAAKYSYKSYIDTSINNKQKQLIPDRDYSPSLKTYELCEADD